MPNQTPNREALADTVEVYYAGVKDTADLAAHIAIGAAVRGAVEVAVVTTASSYEVRESTSLQYPELRDALSKAQTDALDFAMESDEMQAAITAAIDAGQDAIAKAREIALLIAKATVKQAELSHAERTNSAAPETSE